MGKATVDALCLPPLHMGQKGLDDNQSWIGEATSVLTILEWIYLFTILFTKCVIIQKCSPIFAFKMSKFPLSNVKKERLTRSEGVHFLLQRGKRGSGAKMYCYWLLVITYWGGVANLDPRILSRARKRGLGTRLHHSSVAVPYFFTRIVWKVFR